MYFFQVSILLRVSSLLLIAAPWCIIWVIWCFLLYVTMYWKRTMNLHVLTLFKMYNPIYRYFCLMT